MVVHSPLIAELLSDQYSLDQISNLKKILKPVLQIKTTSKGIVQASNRNMEKDPTNYDAVWVRDSVWIARALMLDEKDRGVKVLRTQLDYMNSPAQEQRFKDLILNSEKIKDANATMLVPHIRFDGKSETFEDVMEQGKPQSWNHKQNDALGIFLLTTLECIENGTIGKLSVQDLKAVLLMPYYFYKVQYYKMPDAGAWEEIERVNTSSVALVTASLEKLVSCLEKNDFRSHLQVASKELGLKDCMDFILSLELFDLIQKGYETVYRQLPDGESPGYPKEDPRYRESDAALLSLILPANLRKFTKADRHRVIQHIYPLVGQVGIKRYIGDAYQCEGYWQTQTDVSEKTRDYSSQDEFVKRASGFKKIREAEWFFDSWFSYCLGEMYRETGDDTYLDEQIHFFNRALGQITGGTAENPVLGADGNAVPPFEMPESYNVTKDGFAPSPITPLNWAKASLRIAIDGIERSTCYAQR
jgi:hypothetical protein